MKGSDGLTHLAYSLFFANSWNYSATLKSIEVIDPMKGDAVTGKNQVLTSKNEDVTGQFRILSRPQHWRRLILRRTFHQDNRRLCISM